MAIMWRVKCGLFRYEEEVRHSSVYLNIARYGLKRSEPEIQTLKPLFWGRSRKGVKAIAEKFRKNYLRFPYKILALRLFHQDYSEQCKSENDALAIFAKWREDYTGNVYKEEGMVVLDPPLRVHGMVTGYDCLEGKTEKQNKKRKCIFLICEDYVILAKVNSFFNVLLENKHMPDTGVEESFVDAEKAGDK